MKEVDLTSKPPPLLRPEFPILDQNVTQVVCGMDHTVALLSTGAVVAWGANSACQCTGVGAAATPRPVQLPPCGLVAAGPHCSGAIGRDAGGLWLWGRGSELGLPLRRKGAVGYLLS